jgi:glyoxylase-like metal-dependent hydrolase (beta-lactamase superfamily II)
VHERGAAQLDTEGVRPLQDCGTVSIGDAEVTVLHTPGHCGDAVCYFIPAGCAADGTPKLISGDTLFVDRVGKTNERDIADLWQSLQWLMQLPDATEVYPGHDYGGQPVSTIGREKQQNPFLTVSDFDDFKAKRLGS